MSKMVIIVSGIIVLISSHTFPTKHLVKSMEVQNWINVEYVKCLQQKLPCECEKRTKTYFIINIDTSMDSRFFGIRCMGYNDMEFDDMNLIKELKDKYKVTKTNNDVNQVVGSIQLLKDTLYFSGKERVKSAFVCFDKSEIMDNASNFLKSEFQYQMLNINLLNKAFIKRNYPLLETTLIDETLSCGCNKELGELNLISGKSKSWIIEQNSDSVFLYDFINSSEGKSIPVRIQKKLLKAYKW